MPSIDRMTQLLTTLRQELNGQVRNKRVGTPNTSGDQTTVRVSAPSAAETLKAHIERELKRFNLKAPEDRKHARRLFIESAVTWDFGEEISQDPKLSFLVRDIEASISEDEEASKALDDLLSTLQAFD